MGSMTTKTVLLSLIFLCSFLLIAGCTQTESKAPPTVATTSKTPVPTTSPASVTVVNTVVTETPEVLQTLPDTYAVEVQVASNGVSVDPKIIVTFRGGRGINFVTQVESVITRPDGTTGTEIMNRPKVSDYVELKSSGGDNDRVRVYITISNGQKFLVYDQVVPFKQRG